MFAALVFALLALAFALLRGGSLNALAQTEFRWVPVLIAGLAVQLALGFGPAADLSRVAAVALILGSYVAVALFTFVNRQLAGMLLASFGLALNALVIAVNVGMPVSPRAAEIAGTSAPQGAAMHEALDEQTLLPFLADVIPLPGAEEVVSVGDLILAAGIARLIYMQMEPRGASSASGSTHEGSHAWSRSRRHRR